MLEVNIFVASSFEVAEWREAIGHAIGMFSEEWEPRGYRIRMKCWEDYHPEFNGERKQDQYNRDLVLNSQIFVALFAERCGSYTQEEVRLGKTHCADDLYVLRKAGVASDAVDQFLHDESLTAEECTTELEVTDKIRGYIESYVGKHATDGEMRNQEQKFIYGTIPEDCREYRSQFGNMVRSLDDMMCENANLRCRLRMDTPVLVCRSNYYAAILKDALSRRDEKELADAISRVGTPNLPEVVQLYADYDNKAIADNPALNALIQSKGLFPEAFQGNMFRVRYNLFRWLLRSMIIKVDEQAGLDVRDGMLTFFNMPIISVDSLKIKASSKEELVTKVIRQISFSVLCDEATAAKKPEETIDLELLDRDIEANTQMLGVASDIVAQAISTLNGQRQQISARITYLNTSEDVRSQHVEELSLLTIRLAKIQDQLLAHGQGNPYDLLRTQMLTVQMHDTYTAQFLTLGYDINAHYKQMADTADEYHIFDPTIEMMRFNYANHLARTNQNSEALRIYGQVASNLSRIDDSSKLIRAYVMHLSVTYINHLSELDQTDMARAAITQLEGKIRRWNESGRSDVDMLIDEVRLMACKLRVPNVNEEDRRGLIDDALRLYRRLRETDMGEIPVGLWDEMYCDFPIVITANLTETAIQRKDPEYFKTGIALQKEVIRVVELTDILDDHSALTNLGKAYHNIGFIYSHGFFSKALQCTKEALACRRKVYEMKHLESDLRLVAETLLLMGSIYADRQRLAIHKLFPKESEREALKYADECLAIYSSLDTEHYLNQVTDVYMAKLLRGSILVWSQFDEHVEEGVSLLLDCLQWDKQHPDNTYHQTILDIASLELKRLRII